MKKLLAALCLLLTVASAHAQTGSVKTQTQLNTEIGTTGCSLPTCLYPDTPPAAITAFGLRQGLLDLNATLFAGGGPLFTPGTTTITGATPPCVLVNSATTVSGCIDLTNSYLAPGSFTNITGVGTLTAGTWNATPIAVAYGGTGGVTASGTLLDNITGFSSTGLIDRTGAGAYSFTAPGTGVLTALGNAVNGASGLLTYGIIGTSGATICLLNGATCTFGNIIDAPGFDATTLGSVSAVAYGFNSAKTGFYSGSQDASVGLSINGSDVLDYGITTAATLTAKTAFAIADGGSWTGTISGTPTLSGANFVSYANVAQAGAYTLLGNFTASTANQTATAVSSFPTQISPATTDLLIVADHTTGKIQQSTIAQVVGSLATGVTSFDGLTGAVIGNSGVGPVLVYYNGSAWVYQEPNGNIVTPSTTTCAVQEALTYAAANGYLSVVWNGQDQKTECNTTTTITKPAAYSGSLTCIGVYANLITGGGASTGIVLDTQRYSKIDCGGSVFNYEGTGSAWLIQPSHGPGAISCTSNSTACWAIDESYNLGVIFAATASSNSCVQIDISQGNGASQLLSSSWNNNSLSFTCEGQTNVDYALQWISPSNAYQAGGENSINFVNIEGYSVEGLSIGQGSTVNDASLGTNIYTGNIAITGSTASTRGIGTDSSWDRFNLASINCYSSVGSQHNVVWDANAANNAVSTAQAIKCGGGYTSDGSTAKTSLLVSSIPCQPKVTVESSGSGSTFTPSTCPAVNGVPALMIDTEIMGGGGSGAGSGTSASNGTAGNASSVSLGGTGYATGGAGGAGQAANGSPGTGGSTSGNCSDGQPGGTGSATAGYTIAAAGGMGGSSRYGGAGVGGYAAGAAAGGAGQAAVANSGSGGGGGGSGTTTGDPGGGGGAGAWCRAFPSQPQFINSAITYTVGASVSGGGAGTTGAAGGAGGAGKVVFTERWN